MRSVLLMLLVNILLSSVIELVMGGEVWRFGSQEGCTADIHHEHGRMGVFTKKKYIHLYVPDCYEIRYVYVWVSNWLSSPSVKYNREHLYVLIEYQWYQYSWSSYEVLVRGVVSDSIQCRNTTKG